MISISANQYALICRPFTHTAITSQKSALIQITALTVFTLTTGIFELYMRNMTNLKYEICALIINVIMSHVMTSTMIATNLAFVILTLPPTVFRVICFFFQLEKINYRVLQFKWTHTVYFSSPLYIINQKPMIPRIHFHCITTWLHAFLGEIRLCICLFCDFSLLARWRYYPI